MLKILITNLLIKIFIKKHLILICSTSLGDEKNDRWTYPLRKQHRKMPILEIYANYQNNLLIKQNTLSFLLLLYIFLTLDFLIAFLHRSLYLFLFVCLHFFIFFFLSSSYLYSMHTFGFLLEISLYIEKCWTKSHIISQSV